MRNLLHRPWTLAGRHPLRATVIFCALLQLLCATYWVPGFESPNTSAITARRLAADGQYVMFNQRFWGPNAPPDSLRRYELPGGPLFLAAGFRLLPEPLWRFIYVPVTVSMVVSVACFAGWLGGNSLALLTGLVASLQPFLLRHGAVWDDSFLASGLVWFCLALLARRFTGAAPPSRMLRSALLLAAGWAGVTRAESQAILLLVVLLIFLLPAWRRLRVEASAIGVGLLLALSAWGLRNLAVTGEFALGSSHDGISFWEAVGPHARQSLRLGTVEVLSYDPRLMQQHWERTATMSEGEVSRYFTRLGFSYIASHPLDFLKTALFKLVVSLLGLALDQPLGAPRNVVAIAGAVTLYALAVRGWPRLRTLLALPPGAFARPVIAVIALLILVILLLGPTGIRYHLTFDGVLWIAAAAALEPLLDARFRRHSDAQ